MTEISNHKKEKETDNRGTGDYDYIDFP